MGKCTCGCGCKKWYSVLLHILLGAGAIALLGWVVMLLWNWLIPDVMGWSVVNYCQAFGLFILGRLLVGGLKFGHGCKCKCGCNDDHGHHFHHKWDKMSAEQRKEFIEKCQCGCRDDEPAGE